MKTQNPNHNVERRGADRVSDNSLLIVSGKRTDGEPFSELTSIRDVSTGGISFYLSLCLSLGDIVDLSIYSEKWTLTETVPRFQIKCRVLRIEPILYNKNQLLVAAEFASNFVSSHKEEDFEAVVRLLQQAVVSDENRRQQYE